MQNRRTKQEQRVLAYYALQEGGKALEEGLMQNSKFKMRNAKFKIKLFAFNKTLCEPTAYRLVVELEAQVSEQNT